MPKKLVLDRGISLKLSGGQVTTVPDGEVWSVSIHESDYNAASLLDGNGQLRSFARASFSGGTSFSAYFKTSIITGLAFKLQEV
ncbi:hypothetical protein [Aedoeadaptatus pacaensis]|uniref:hypothetical protein n=1 Tax=Aedoeadaptatus pacaensis TaxID=1776390 RepID=UPI00083905BE|nr:hypothetical protein [Peptoniphilus pacaensis]